MEYSNKGSIKRVFNMFVMPIIILFIVLLIIKGLLFLLPICIIGFLGYKGIKLVNSKFKGTNYNNTNNVDFKEVNSKKEYNFETKIIDVEYEDVKK
ncbi:hypothetical protein [Clostridium botulinum]|uniref:ABC transporter n=2 Tax=Clostridium botulinum TaxID=1491 RepID=A0A9Q1ZAH3_CLOBO|nr:hypothetical protein [Clostridium botulinum]KEI00451.1 ABC transporter [Clostridium botulinum D str. 16868]KEI00607.1 ABC transporter [Clostridium botulinum C/D str. Sp77]KLU76151.1 ABC transporter [Clostridium botulinum V891]KOA76981.1 ABC transporter [Clostridium botulinum]KOA77356.1 ABC transporter [Clostridium botulinum]